MDRYLLLCHNYKKQKGFVLISCKEGHGRRFGLGLPYCACIRQCADISVRCLNRIIAVADDEIFNQ